MNHTYIKKKNYKGIIYQKVRLTRWNKKLLERCKLPKVTKEIENPNNQSQTENTNRIRKRLN